MGKTCKKWMIKTGVLLLLLFSSPSVVFATDTIKESISKNVIIEKGVKKVGKPKLTSPSKNKIKVKWKALGDNYLYEVQCSPSSKFPKSMTITSRLGHKNTVPVNLGGASGRVVYVRVRAFHRWKYAYGPWSSVAKIRVK